MGVARAPNRRVPVRLRTPLCALRKMQTLTRRPKAVSHTRRVAASSSANRSSGQFRIARPSGRSNSSPASTRSATRIRSKSSNLIASTSNRHHAPGAVRDSGSRTSPRYIVNVSSRPTLSLRSPLLTATALVLGEMSLVKNQRAGRRQRFCRQNLFAIQAESLCNLSQSSGWFSAPRSSSMRFSSSTCRVSSSSQRECNALR